MVSPLPVAFAIVDGFEAPVAELQAAGQASRGVSDGVRGVNLTGAASSIGDVMPGGASQAAGDNLQVAWSAAITSLSGAMGRHAEALAAAAKSYADAERLMAQFFNPAGAG
jgi:hypothetical protein